MASGWNCFFTPRKQVRKPSSASHQEITRFLIITAYSNELSGSQRVTPPSGLLPQTQKRFASRSITSNRLDFELGTHHNTRRARERTNAEAFPLDLSPLKPSNVPGVVCPSDSGDKPVAGWNTPRETGGVSYVDLVPRNLLPLGLDRIPRTSIQHL